MTTPATPSFINRHPFISAILITLLMFIFLVLTTTAVISAYAYHQLRTLTNAAHTTPSQLYHQLKTGWHQPVTQTNQHKNILLLGVDSLATRGNVPPLTDTMMVVSLNLDTGTITSLPLPRDLWSDEYQTKINALYAYGQEKYPDQPEKFPTEVVASLTGLPIHHTVVVSLDQVGGFIDLVGGVEINVDPGFVDPTFPRSDVDVTTERDPQKLYERIEFKSGPQTMSGDQALKFIRSRHSPDNQGTDLARSQRQQQVVAALMKKLTSSQTLTNPQLLGELYTFYQQHFGTFVSIEEGIATTKALAPHFDQLRLTQTSLSIFPQDEQGVLINPKPSAKYQNQWVYVIKDPTQFKTEIHAKIN